MPKRRRFSFAGCRQTREAQEGVSYAPLDRPRIRGLKMARRARSTAVSTLKLCRLAVGATGGCVRQCEALDTGSKLLVA